MTPIQIQRAIEANLSLTKLAILHHCSESPVMLRELSKAIRCSQANLTGIVDGMEREGLVSREPKPGDRRVKMLTITKKGSGVLAGIIKPVKP